jgi:sugar lactone lactonase YvrE
VNGDNPSAIFLHLALFRREVIPIVGVSAFMFFFNSPPRRIAALLMTIFGLVCTGRGQTTPIPSFTVSHFAGSTGGSGGSDGQSGASQFNTPRGIAVDAAGNVFVTDAGNYVIRKITPAGVVTTFAGKQGESAILDGARGEARFSSPRDLAIDAAGNLYTTDFYTVRKITAQGDVTTLAGTAGALGFVNGVGSSARFAYLYAVAPDAAGNVYVSDYGNNALRKISPTGVVTTLPEIWSPPGFSLGLGGGAHGMAIDNAGFLLVSRAAGTGIGRVAADGAYTTLDGSTPGLPNFLFAMGLSVDVAGNVYFVESSSNVVRKITPDRVVTTFAGTRGSAGFNDGIGEHARFNYPEDTAADSNGNIYVADSGNDLIRKISPAGVVTTIGGSQIAETGNINGTGAAARFNTPTHVALDSSGNLFVSDSANSAIRKITPNGAVSTFVAAPQIERPAGLVFDDAGNLYVVDSGRWKIVKVAPDGAVTHFSGDGLFAGMDGSYDGAVQYAAFHSPSAITRSPSGVLYVIDDATIRKVAPDGSVTTLAGGREQYGVTDGVGAAARFGLDLTGIVAIDDNNLFVADGPLIRHIDAAGRVTTFAGDPHEFTSVDGVGASARIAFARGIAADPAGNLYITEGGGAVRRITRNAMVTTIGPAQSGGTDARIEGPYGITIDPAGNLYVAATGSHAIFKGTLNSPLPGAAPRSATTTAGGDFTASMSGLGPGPFTYQWHFNGRDLPGKTEKELLLTNAQPADAGLYGGVVTSGAWNLDMAPAILGIVTADKVVGTGAEIDDDIKHPNGNWYDQVLLSGASATITADAGQVTRISYVDLDDDIVQVEFSGAGSLTLSLKNPTEPAPPLLYNQPRVSYVKGHASIVIAGANATTNVSVFSVGRANAIDQTLFKEDVSYDGIADIAYIAILSADGKFGGVRTANVSYFANAGTTGLYAPGVEFVGPVYVGDIIAFDDARSALILGAADDVSVTGGDLSQPNDRAVAVKGVSQLKFADGTTSHGTLLPAQTNQARLEQDGIDVTAEIVLQE